MLVKRVAASWLFACSTSDRLLLPGMLSKLGVTLIDDYVQVAVDPQRQH